MELGLAGRTAIVCGASSGMGLAIAETLAGEGANVAVFARRREVLEREAERIGALAVQGDLTIPQHLERLVQATVGAFGGIDVLVLNGGGPPAGPASGLTAEAVEEAVALLLTAHVTLVARCLPHLRESGRGRIVAIESSSVREPLANHGEGDLAPGHHQLLHEGGAIVTIDRLLEGTAVEDHTGNILDLCFKPIP